MAAITLQIMVNRNPQSAANSLESCLILIADDDRSTRMLLSQIMQQEGYQVVEAVNGEDCLTAYQQFQPQIILLDAMMPVVDGFTCCERIRTLPNSESVPILLITALDDDESVDRAFAAGATDYITKPIHWAVLRQRVRRLLQTQQTAIELERRNEQERLIWRIAQRMRQSLNLNDILKTAVWEMRQLLHSDRVLIYRVQDDRMGRVIMESAAAGLTSILGQCYSSEMISDDDFQLYCQGQIRTINHIDSELSSPVLIQFLQRLGVRAKIVVPILQDDRLWGLLIAHYSETPRLWQIWELNLLQQLSTHLAIAIRQSQFYQQVQQFNADLETILEERMVELRQRTITLQRSLDFGATLMRITERVRDSLDERQILQTAVQEVVWALDAGCCNLALYDLEQHVSNVVQEYSASIPGYQGRVLEMSGYPEIYQQLQQGQSFQFCSISPSTERGQVAMFACPIMYGEQPTGDLWLINPADRVLTDLEIQLVQQVANQCAIAIRQARLYQTAQTQVLELERLNHLKDDFLSTVSHELRSPISNMRLAIQMLERFMGEGRDQRDRSGVNNADATKGFTYLKILRNECEREIGLINDLLDLQRLEAGYQRSNQDLIQPSELITEVAELYQQRAQERQQQLVITIPPDLPEIISDLSSLKRVLSELLTNACKYSPPGGTITIHAQMQFPHLQISVSNSGVEIPTQELARIFDKFYRIPSGDPWKQGGTGLGLALVQRLVNHLHGTIQVSSSAGQTCFRVDLDINCQ
ncbi:response regulator [Pantanalinema rosaneae CENA516]|uniref:hybrid sensor histidine kinase/response regulator n=1 Tax=Pantanalinema rosaneae TaxID=1620701 RepID=UPI003D6F295C